MGVWSLGAAALVKLITHKASHDFCCVAQLYKFPVSADQTNMREKLNICLKAEKDQIKEFFNFYLYI